MNYIHFFAQTTIFFILLTIYILWKENELDDKSEKIL